MINIKKVVYVMLLILLLFCISACSSSAKVDDNKSIIDQIMSIREEDTDNKTNSETGKMVQKYPIFHQFLKIVPKPLLHSL